MEEYTKSHLRVNVPVSTIVFCEYWRERGVVLQEYKYTETQQRGKICRLFVAIMQFQEKILLKII